MKRIKLFLTVVILAITTQNSSATLMYFDGSSLITRDIDGNLTLHCQSSTKLCCTYNPNTQIVVVYRYTLLADGDPAPGDGTLTGNVVANTFVENPNDNETVEMGVTDLEVCTDCE